MPKDTIRTGWRQTSGNGIPRMGPSNTGSGDAYPGGDDSTASNYSIQPGGPRKQSNVAPENYDSSVTHRDPEPVLDPNEK